MSVVFALSFLLRAGLNIFIASHPERVQQMQCHSVVDGDAGWTLLVFSLQFFGETLPLSILFYIQHRNATPRSTSLRKSSQSPLLSRPAPPKIDEDNTESTNAQSNN